MMSLECLLGCVATEAVEAISESRRNDPTYKPKNDLPPIRIDLELIEEPDGSLKWYENEPIKQEY